MLSYIRAAVVLMLLFFAAGLFAGEVGAAEGPSSAAVAGAAPTMASPVLLAQYSGYSNSSGSNRGVRLPYGVIRLIVLGVMGAGGWLGSKLYR